MGHGAADRRFDQAVHGLGTQDEPGMEPGPDAAALVDATEGVLRRAEAGSDAMNLWSKPAQGEEHAPSHLPPEGLREHEPRTGDLDRHFRGGRMVPQLLSCC
jgi:hypothetical protein